MNKVMLMGNLTRDPDVRYSQGSNPMAVAKYGLAVRRQFVKKGDVEVDFFNITAFGKAGEFAEKFFSKGQKVVVVGRLQQSTWDDNGTKRSSIEVIVEEQHFAENKKTMGEQQVTGSQQEVPSTMGYEDDDELPF